MTLEKSPEFSALQPLRHDYDAWLQRDQELSRIYALAWRMVADDRDRRYREIARAILAAATDIGIENLRVKEMAEAENEGQTNHDRHAENVQDHSRQLVAPARFLSLLRNMAVKAGKRVHLLDPRYTSRTCSACHHVNPPLEGNEIFTCEHCDRRWNRDENAARNLQKLARECSGGDAHPLRCSRDGKRVPFLALTPSSPVPSAPAVAPPAAVLAGSPATGQK